jgi:hypothetical protein
MVAKFIFVLLYGLLLLWKDVDWFKGTLSLAWMNLDSRQNCEKTLSFKLVNCKMTKIPTVLHWREKAHSSHHSKLCVKFKDPQQPNYVQYCQKNYMLNATIIRPD